MNTTPTPTPIPPFDAPADDRLSGRPAGAVKPGATRAALLATQPPPAAPPRLLDRLREEIRVRHYSIRTEDAYADWARRFIVFHGKRHPLKLGAPEVGAFPTYLAVQRNVAASTQNQAKSALLFLYRVVLELAAGGAASPLDQLEVPPLQVREPAARCAVLLEAA